MSTARFFMQMRSAPARRSQILRTSTKTQPTAPPPTLDEHEAFNDAAMALMRPIAMFMGLCWASGFIGYQLYQTFLRWRDKRGADAAAAEAASTSQAMELR
jgi:hypothetical protein